MLVWPKGLNLRPFKYEYESLEQSMSGDFDGKGITQAMIRIMLATFVFVYLSVNHSAN